MNLQQQLTVAMPFPFANTLSNGVTEIHFQYDTSQYSSTDELQIFVEDEVVTTRPYDFGTDAIERQRVSNTLSMLDADFEYGISQRSGRQLTS